MLCTELNICYVVGLISCC